MPERQSAPLNGESDISLELIGLKGFDTDVLTHVVNGAELEHRRLPGGGTGIQLLQCRLPGSVINRGIYSPAVLVNGRFDFETITIGTMLRQNQPTIVNGFEVRMGTFQFYAEGCDMCYRAWPDATWLAFVLPRERLLEFCADYLDEVPDLPSRGITTVESRTKESGEQLLDRLRDLDSSLRGLGSLRNAARLGESVERDLLARIANHLSAKPAVRKAHDRHRLRLCNEILRDSMKLVENNPGEMLDLQSMSKATGFSPRTLQRTFQTEYGLCPQEWLRVERLNRVRADLLNVRLTSVTEAATRWGFFHLGRFAQYYRGLFGERPSETLARSAAAL